MDTVLTFIFLLRCWCVWSLPRGPSVSFSVAFSDGTLLLVDVGEEAADDSEDDGHSHQNEMTDRLPAPHEQMRGSGPSVQILSSALLSQGPGPPSVLVCLLTGLNSPLQDVVWWVNDTALTSPDAAVSWMRSEGGGAYSVTSVWEPSAEDWRSSSTYWCGTMQDGRVYREKVCWGG